MSWEISNSMESSFRCDVLRRALETYGTPEIFNTDQGSQYTSNTFTSILIRAGAATSEDGQLTTCSSSGSGAAISMSTCTFVAPTTVPISTPEPTRTYGTQRDQAALIARRRKPSRNLFDPSNAPLNLPRTTQLRFAPVRSITKA